MASLIVPWLLQPLGTTESLAAHRYREVCLCLCTVSAFLGFNSKYTELTEMDLSYKVHGLEAWTWVPPNQPQLANLPLLFIQPSIHSTWKTPEMTEGEKETLCYTPRPDYAKLCENSVAAALENRLGGGDEKASQRDSAHSRGYNLDLTSTTYFMSWNRNYEKVPRVICFVSCNLFIWLSSLSQQSHTFLYFWQFLQHLAHLGLIKLQAEKLGFLQKKREQYLRKMITFDPCAERNIWRGIWQLNSIWQWIFLHFPVWLGVLIGISDKNAGGICLKLMCLQETHKKVHKKISHSIPWLGSTGKVRSEAIWVNSWGFEEQHAEDRAQLTWVNC